MPPLLETRDPLLKSYLTGFVLAVGLTLLAFALVVFKLVAELPALSAVAVLAVAQMAVHLHYFLHLDLSSRERANLLALGFAAVIIFLLAGGTVWILFDLHYRMMV